MREEGKGKVEEGGKGRAVDMAVTQIERLFGKGSIIEAGRAAAQKGAGRLDRIHRASTIALGNRRRAARAPSYRNIRPGGIKRQDDACPPDHRRGPEDEAAPRPSSTPSTPSRRALRGQEIGVRHGRPTDLAAGHGRAGPGDHGDPSMRKRRRGNRSHRLRGGPGARGRRIEGEMGDQPHGTPGAP